ncbi:hypothetical protein QUF86_08625 [Peribacillus sp. NJ11]|uniref:hypothetical protein n=1 Tax=Peribacillus sp. NJ11 TaxID=3055861 RepID=UPI0025A02E9F|nr:hypothetical protein [Peribacillus sp. NJ11]MDM5220813.1 hypothetical protein [Peribacillus sp. NJ11]
MSKKRSRQQQGKPPQTKEKNSYFTPQNVIAIAAALIALLGVWLTHNTYKLTAEQFNLAFEQNENENKAVWISKVDSKDERITFISNSDHIVMQRAFIYFPEPFTDSNREILFPNFELPTSVLTMDVKEYLNSKFTREKGKALVAEGNIPFALQSYYISKGNSYSIQSVYHLRYIATLGERDNDFPTFEIQGFWFDHHLDVNEDPQEALKKVWVNGEYRADYTGLEN